MKCSICGHRSNTIQAMAAHYRKKHPRKMAARKKPSSSGGYCSKCGRKL